MLTHESEKLLNSVLVQHVSLHLCKNCNGPEVLERAVHYNETLTTPNFEGTIIVLIPVRFELHYRSLCQN